MVFRKLLTNEIQVRVKTSGSNDKGAWCMCLLYKDARADMTILDETVGTENWQRKHECINGDIYCSVGIFCNGEWIWKQDCGTEGESGTEVEKSRASDSFKRACVNWGIGRELYTAPQIYIKLHDGEYKVEGGKVKMSNRLKFVVSSITYAGDKIEHLVIVDNKGNERFRV